MKTTATRTTPETTTDEQRQNAEVVDDDKLTEEEREQLGRMMDECHRTGATPLMDALLADKDWSEEELFDIYRNEVERRLIKAGHRPAESRESGAFFDHVQRCFQGGNAEAQCAKGWLARLS